MFRSLDGCLFPAKEVNWGILELYEGKAEGIIDLPFNFFDEIGATVGDFIRLRRPIAWRETMECVRKPEII